MGECEGEVRVVCEGECGGERDTPPSLLEIKGAQAARVDGDVGPPLQTGALLAPLQPSRMTSTIPDLLLSGLQNLKVEHERKGPSRQLHLAAESLTTLQDVLSCYVNHL